MPTRPVTWDLDAPPAGLLRPQRKDAAGEVPSLKKLRSSLMGGRFELVKISAFAGFLLALVALAVHGSQLASSDNQFAVSTEVALRDLSKAVSLEFRAVSRETASMRGKTNRLTNAIALATTRDAQGMLHRASALTARASAPKADAQAATPANSHPAHAARAHHQAHAIDAAETDAVTSGSRHVTLGATKHGGAAAGDSTSLKNLLSPDSMIAGIVGLVLST